MTVTVETALLRLVAARRDKRSVFRVILNRRSGSRSNKNYERDERVNDIVILQRRGI